jgi:cytochrome c553
MKQTILLLSVLLSSAVLTARAADAQANWDTLCKKCHGEAGKGDTKMGQKLGIKDYSDAAVQAKMSDEEMFKAIKEGVKDGEKVKMKPAENLSDDEIKALVKHVRNFKK